MNKFLFSTSFIFFVSLVFLSGCSSNKSKDHKPAELTDFDAKVEIKYLWGRNIGKLDRYYHQFQIALDTTDLYAASKSGRVGKFDKLTGRTEWEVNLNKQLTAALAIDDSRIFVGTIDGKLLALDKANGKELWSKQLSSEMVSTPVISRDHLVVQTNDGAVFDINPENGTQRWKYDSNMPALTLRGTGSAVFFEPYVAIGFANGMLGIIDMTTGQLRWQDKVAVAKGDTEIERLVDIDSQPLVVANRLYAISFQGKVTAYDIQTGRNIWSDDESSYRNMAQGQNNIYVASESGAIKAYDQLSGIKVWQQEGLLKRKPTAVTTVADYLVVSDIQGVMHVLDQKTGKFVGRRGVTLPPRPVVGHSRLTQVKRLMKTYPGIRATAIADDMRVYVLADNGKLVAYQLNEIDKKG